MGLYQRDFMKITDEEKEKWEEVQQEELRDQVKNFSRPNYSHKYPIAVRHFLSFFPNHYMDNSELKDAETRFKDLAEKYKAAIDDTTATELDIKSFIKENEAYFLIASIVKNYDFGHHDLYLFPEFLLGNSYKVDYLIVGENSYGYHFIFVEMENPYNKITIAGGKLGDTFRKGINQINDWKQYLTSNFSRLEETYNKYKKPTLSLPTEFSHYEPGRVHYVVVAGRRTDFNKRTRWEKMTYKDNQKIDLLHYDNLYDRAKAIIGGNTY
ncbi:DUF4263 domain-containing protein [Priestia megaterium]|uniref:DUF4263 domain-containing protein n=1 Tax=Priestia megaterium TaxID=1404 RepID=UPI0021D65944|nr:DUF4263 domain-containing protein [Priestia megaterium]MCU7741431.1 DUF4263 domain-containing protein [Priestia megaterium]